MNEIELIRRFGARKGSDSDNEQLQVARDLLMKAIDEERKNGPRSRQGLARVSSPRRIVAVAVAVLAIPGGYGLAQGMGDGQVIKITPETAQPAPPPLEANPTAPPPQATSTGASVNVLGKGPLPPQLVERCQDNPNSQRSCDLVLAIDANEIAPGRYTDEELRQALIAAGYDGDF
jgi:hypothetical protein